MLVKSFGFDSESGGARERRWIETRLLTRQQGEWVGYSYAWNREQTEAHLVGSQGRDASVEISLGESGKGRLDWRFPQPERVHGLSQPGGQLRPGTVRRPR